MQTRPRWKATPPVGAASQLLAGWELITRDLDACDLEPLDGATFCVKYDKIQAAQGAAFASFRDMPHLVRDQAPNGVKLIIGVCPN